MKTEYTTMIKNAYLIYFSPCGGTEKVMRALARDLPLPTHEYNITLPQNRLSERYFNADDLVVMGFPVYGGRMPRFLSSLIAHIKGRGTPLVMVAVYGNRAYEGAFLDMHAGVRANGFNPIAAVAAVAEHSIAPHIGTGRPDADDGEKLAQFGLQALHKAQTDKETLTAPGAYPTWTMPPDADVFPHADIATCTCCGQCVEVCPNGSIPAETPHLTNREMCLVCAACLKHCPVNARRFGNTATEKEYASHLQNSAPRKEAVLFV